MALDAKTFVFEDVCKHNKPDDCWVIIFGKVYDVTSFMYDHPGGDKALLEGTGKDATDAFEDFGHSDDAVEMMNKYCIGMIDKSTLPVTPRYYLSAADKFYKSYKTPQFIVDILQFLVPIVILGLVFTVTSYTKEKSI